MTKPYSRGYQRGTNGTPSLVYGLYELAQSSMCSNISAKMRGKQLSPDVLQEVTRLRWWWVIFRWCSGPRCKIQKCE